MGLIRRSFTFLDGDLFKKLYSSFVRPQLEYAYAVWSPFLKKNIALVENAQRRGTKLIDGFYELSYNERLQRLDLQSLKYRRERNDMIQIYKHFQDYDTVTHPPSCSRRQRPSRKHDFQLMVKTPEDGVRGQQTNSFYYRATKVWNDLPSHVVNASTLATFKRKLDDEWKDRHLYYP